MLTKTPRAGKAIEVTFRMPPIDGVVELFLCGDFNDWQKSGQPLRREADGSWVTTLTLEAGKSYRFRYFDNQGRWHNDWDADAYVPNAFGSEDSVVDLVSLLPQVQREGGQPPAGSTRSSGKRSVNRPTTHRRAQGPSGKGARGRRGGPGRRGARG